MLIDSLISTVENAEKQTSTHAGNEQRDSSSPLTVDEVLFRSGFLGASRPSTALPSSHLEANR
jgi:hypothetical protein